MKLNRRDLLFASSGTQKHLGLEDSGHGVMLPSREKDNPENEQITVWSIFAGNTKYFEPSSASFMVNYIVDDLEALLNRLAKKASKSTLSAAHYNE
jgi:hypothetical protein